MKENTKWEIFWIIDWLSIVKSSCSSSFCSHCSHLQEPAKQKTALKINRNGWSKVIWSVVTSHLSWLAPSFFYLDSLTRWIMTGWPIFSYINRSSVEFFLYDRNSWQRPVIYGLLVSLEYAECICKWDSGKRMDGLDRAPPNPSSLVTISTHSHKFTEQRRI